MSIGLARLDAALKAAGVPLVGVADVTGLPPQPGWHTVQRADGKTVRIDYAAGATAAQQQTGDQLAQGADLGPRTARPLWAIYSDLKALSATQKTNIWADLSAGSPPKYLADAGPNAAALVALDWAATDSGASGAALTAARLRLAGMYVQDNPGYLVTPAFDATINVPGDQPA